MASDLQSIPIGDAIVIGGCGFVGYHIVKHLAEQPDRGSITVISRKPEHNKIPGVKYVAGDLTDREAMQRLLSDLKPQIIFHVAAPRATNEGDVPDQEHYRINVQGTESILACAEKTPSVRALVYTSTCAVAKDYEHINVNEDAPLWDEKSKTLPYFKTKALADAMVLEANTSKLRTCTLRLPMVYGERDNQFIPANLKLVMGKNTKVQLGDGKNRVQPHYVGNAAKGHVLAAKALLGESSKGEGPRVGGEAFILTDGESQPFWEFSRRAWRHVGDTTKPEEITIVPGWLALAIASTVEWAFYLFTFGFGKVPLNMSRIYIQYSVYSTTYDISKARSRLGYEPVVDHDEHLRRSFAWELEQYPEKYPNLRTV